MKKYMILVIMLLFVACDQKDQQETKKLTLSPGPSFSSKAQPGDSGEVKPLKKADKKIRIAVIGLENNPFWNYVKDGTLFANKELEQFNGQVDWIIPPGENHTSEVFGSSIDAAIVQQYDAIATIAGDSGIIPYMNRAVEAGIPVATFNVETQEPSKRLFFVGADLYSQGQSAGKAFAEFWQGRGIDNPKVAVLTGFFSVEGLEQRRKGFLDYIEQNLPQAEVVGQVETKDSDEIGYQQTVDFITANPALNAVYSAAGGTIGASRAIEEKGLKDTVYVFGYDYYPEIIDYVKKGIIAGTIGQQPFAQGHDPAIRLFNYIVSQEVPPAGILNTKSNFLTAENIDSVLGKRNY